MNKLLLLSSITFILISRFTGAFAGELAIDFDFYYPNTSKSAKLHAKIKTTDGTVLNITDQERQIPFSFDDNSDLIKTFHIISANSFDNYTPLPLSLNIPFYSGNRLIEVNIVYINTNNDDYAEHKYIWNTNPRTIHSKDKLFEFHARSHRQAQHILSLGAPDATLRRDHVRTIYAYLQSAHRLALEYHINPSKTTLESRSWLTQALLNNKTTVASSVKIAHIEHIISQVDDLQLDQYEILWRKILNLSAANTGYYCKILGRFQSHLSSLSPETLAVVNKKNLTALVGSAFAACLADGYRDRSDSFDICEYFPKKTLEQIMNDQIVYLEGQKQLAASKNWYTLENWIQRDIFSLRDLAAHSSGGGAYFYCNN